MKANQVYVGVNGATLALSGGNKAVAVYPAAKGAAKSYLLLDTGRISILKGARINGVGVARFLKENGFALAQPGDPMAAKLADYLDTQEGLELVEAASIKKAQALQQELQGKTCTFVPFEESRPIVEVVVTARAGYMATSFDLVNAFSSGTVETAFDVKNGLGSDLALSAGWLVGPTGDATKMPRNTDYGGPVEHAVFVMCNCGLGAIVGEQNLVMAGEDAGEEVEYPRGKLEIALTNGDHLRVAINGGDEPEVTYFRDGAPLYSRTGMYGTRLGEAVGAIAAVLVRVAELDAEPVKKSRKKAA
ncbi:hypothetical protein [Burkholderia ubonensis]|uniref:hypothetical protein n=1 Tax=Burkholderia ubonensis TaxID=101571 RepID=UPI000756FA34|nr:hypothetical protein [Burkholderia ubonensis]KVP16884.1 hypothetical protein WJ84_01005 [Burkholderia ubonensis]